MGKCPKGKIINPKTGRCVKKNGKIGKEIVRKSRKSTRKTRKSTRKSRKSTRKTRKSSNRGKILNPETGRYVEKSGVIGQQIMKNFYHNYCPPGKIRNPKTGRCINNPGKFVYTDRFYSFFTNTFIEIFRRNSFQLRLLYVDQGKRIIIRFVMSIIKEIVDLATRICQQGNNCIEVYDNHIIEAFNIILQNKNSQLAYLAKNKIRENIEKVKDWYYTPIRQEITGLATQIRVIEIFVEKNTIHSPYNVQRDAILALSTIAEILLTRCIIKSVEAVKLNRLTLLENVAVLEAIFSDVELSTLIKLVMKKDVYLNLNHAIRELQKDRSSLYDPSGVDHQVSHAYHNGMFI